ncbi:hypothetical protein Z950_3457 [Sulfitobacter mediterraneus KCTC 32188]|jgi:hypothetical protein|nr:hypothetical protein Z950_3457 [Sulfitobacter mediterraneus KCTC 32188]
MTSVVPKGGLHGTKPHKAAKILKMQEKGPLSNGAAIIGDMSEHAHGCTLRDGAGVVKWTDLHRVSNL